MVIPSTPPRNHETGSRIIRRWLGVGDSQNCSQEMGRAGSREQGARSKEQGARSWVRDSSQDANISLHTGAGLASVLMENLCRRLWRLALPFNDHTKVLGVAISTLSAAL